MRAGFVDRWQHRDILVRQLRQHPLTWYRIGVMGDPSHAWDHTLAVIRHLRPAEKTAVIVTKHWTVLTDDHISQLLELDVVVQHVDQRARHRRRRRSTGSGNTNGSGTTASGVSTEW